MQRQQEQERSRKVHVMDEEELRLLASGDQTVTHLPGNQSSSLLVRGMDPDPSVVGVLRVTDQRAGSGSASRLVPKCHGPKFAIF